MGAGHSKGAIPTPTAFCPSAQGWSHWRPTLGIQMALQGNPNGVVAQRRWRCESDVARDPRVAPTYVGTTLGWRTLPIQGIFEPARCVEQRGSGAGPSNATNRTAPCSPQTRAPTSEISNLKSPSSPRRRSPGPPPAGHANNRRLRLVRRAGDRASDTKNGRRNW